MLYFAFSSSMQEFKCEVPSTYLLWHLLKILKEVIARYVQFVWHDCC